MTSEKLYELLKFLETLDTKLGLQANLEAVGTTLNNLASSPAQPQYQNSLASALAALEAAASNLCSSISPSQFAAISAMGGEEFFDPSISGKVKTAVQMNAMTPSVARDFVQDLASRRSSFLSTVRTARQSLEQLRVSESTLQAGSADLAFQIPHEIFQSELGSFAKELRFINRLIEHYSEAITGTAEPAKLEQLSSSVPTVALIASVPVIGAIATVVNMFLTAWERIEKIRKIRGELVDIGMNGDALDQLTEQITTTVDEVVEESTVLVLAKYDGDGGRKRELENAVRQDTRRLFGQIERGLTIEFRANSDGDDEDGGNQAALEGIDSLARTLRFPEVAREPMLLGSSEIVDGDIIDGGVVAVKQVRKTTTRKTVTKGPAKDGDGRAAQVSNN